MLCVQANILLCAMYMTPNLSLKENLFERAQTFQDSIKAGYKTDHPKTDRTLHYDCRRELQVVLSQCYKEVLCSSCK